MAKTKRNRHENKTNVQTSYVTIVSVLTAYFRKIELQYVESVRKMHWLAKIAIVCYLHTYILQVIAVVLAKDDPDRLFECISVACFCGVGLLKLFLLWSKRSRWNFLINQIKSLEEQQLRNSQDGMECVEYDSEEENVENQFAPFISSYNNRFRKISTILVRLYLSTGAFYAVSPIAEYVFKKILLNETLGYPHILPCWAVLDKISFIGYLVTILSEAVASFYCVLVHITFDVATVGVMIFICGQFNLLRHCCERIGGKGKICNVTKERDVRAFFRIKKCHQIHVILINCVNELNKLIKDILGVYFFVATCKLCAVAVRLKTQNMSKMQFVILVQYMVASVTQLFLLCYYGDAVFNESSVIMTQGPFGAAVWCLGPKVRRDLTILGLGMIQPYLLQAGLFNVLNLPSFIQIARTAYSCYAILGQN